MGNYRQQAVEALQCCGKNCETDISAVAAKLAMMANNPFQRGVKMERARIARLWPQHPIIAVDLDEEEERGLCDLCREPVVRIYDYRYAKTRKWKHVSRNYLGGRLKGKRR